MIKLRIRSAIPEDSARIAEIIAAIWPDQPAEQERIREVISSSARSRVALTADGEILGFADGFLTYSVDGVRRWEFDLLAVHPDARRRGAASLLVKSMVEAGRAANAERIRALVRSDNTPMQRVCELAGFRSDLAPHQLLVSANSTNGVETDHGLTYGIYPVPVRTFTYSGLWLEGTITREGLIYALHEVARQDALEAAGVILPSHSKELIEEATQLGYERIGEYNFWYFDL